MNLPSIKGELVFGRIAMDWFIIIYLFLNLKLNAYGWGTCELGMVTFSQCVWTSSSVVFRKKKTLFRQ